MGPFRSLRDKSRRASSLRVATAHFRPKSIDVHAFAGVAFFSIGSNDLTQYVMAAARDNGAVAALNDPTHPSVLRLVESAVRGAATLNVPVSLCGDAGGDPKAIEALLNAGLRSLSVAPAQLAVAKWAVGTVTIRP